MLGHIYIIYICIYAYYITALYSSRASGFEDELHVKGIDRAFGAHVRMQAWTNGRFG